MAAWKIKDRAELRFKYGVLSDYGNSNTGADKEEFRLQLKIII
jgi:hypothetical protein